MSLQQWVSVCVVLVMLIAGVTLGLMVSAQQDLRSVEQVILEWSSREAEISNMSEYETTWTDADGLEHKVVTRRKEGESAADHAARHKVDVQALKAVFPPA